MITYQIMFVSFATNTTSATSAAATAYPSADQSSSLRGGSVHPWFLVGFVLFDF